MDVDARSSWHVVELNTKEVVVSVVGLSVYTNGVDSTLVLAYHDARNIGAVVNELYVILTSFLNLEVRTVNELDSNVEELRSDQEEACTSLIDTTVPDSAAVLGKCDNLELSILLEVYSSEIVNELNAISGVPALERTYQVVSGLLNSATVGQSSELNNIGPVGNAFFLILNTLYLYLILSLGNKTRDSVRIIYVLAKSPLKWLNSARNLNSDVVEID